MSTLDAAGLRTAWIAMLGPPVYVRRFARRATGRGLPDALEVLVFSPPETDRLAEDEQYLFAATAGLALFPPGGATVRAELILEVRGRHPEPAREAIARGLAEFAADLYAGGIEVAPNRVVSGVSLVPFEGMTSALLTNFGVEAPTPLPGTDPPVFVVSVVPLHESEADIVERVGDREASRRFLEEGVEWDDFQRAPALLGPRESTIELEPAENTMSKSAKGKDQGVDGIWSDIEAWFAENAPDQVENLAEPVSDEQVAEFRNATGLALPDEYEASLRRHDGYVYLDDYEYVPLENVTETWSSMKENLDEGEYEELEVADTGGGVIQETFWNAGWIPFAEDSGGNLLCIDTAPGPKGKKGQIVRWEVDSGPAPTEHASFSAWLGAFRDELLGGKFEVVDGSVERKQG